MSSGANPNRTTTKLSSSVEGPPAAVKGGTPMANLCSRVEVVKKETMELLQVASSWPQDSVVAAKELLEMISNAPNLDALEDVRVRLQKTYRKYGLSRDISDLIRYPFDSLSKDGGITVLRTCCDDIDKALVSLRHHMEEIHETRTTQNLPTNDTMDEVLAPQAAGTDSKVLGNSLKGAALIQQPAAGKSQHASASAQPKPDDPPERRRERLKVAQTA
ncbi:hypothetical protein FRC00_009305 [Tulasnella sp. 408]|nr:hypothetical protein FRC00_009305 [Tulasnella sp. 408]